MSTNNWKTVSITFVPALAGLIGVIIGSVITGYFYWKAQELEVKKALDLESYQSSRKMAKDLAEDAAEYFALFGDISGEIAIQNKTEGQLDDQLHRFYKLGLKISFQTSLPTSLKIITMNSVVSNVWSLSLKNKQFSFSKEESAKIQDAFTSLYSEISGHRIKGQPFGLKNELLRFLLQGFISNNSLNTSEHNK